ncbi:YhcN/YlaJ family sporulation lipoprotein [Brevibacillus panacihumi]|uniref:YhcN/YlaJ family sporulation lipoprotein n=1 Tax=Brevibacillus panacihumi TaxID=497735 RepID=UPI0004CF4494|nr:YhcN/YlaJ family sporulation lipoprotein [Brevibacillus panacihumi]
MYVKRSVITTISICLLLSACTTTGNKPPANQAAPKQNQNAPKTQRVQQTNPGPVKNQSAQATADRLVELAKRVPKVNGATAVVVGKYAVVGIDVNAHLDRPQVGVIKYSVAEALKEDPQGATALVTADPDIVQRLREMGADIRNGRPVSGFAEEMADIVGRIIPQTPARVQKREQKPSRENEQRINNDGRSKPQGNDKINVNRKTSP